MPSPLTIAAIGTGVAVAGIDVTVGSVVFVGEEVTSTRVGMLVETGLLLLHAEIKTGNKQIPIMVTTSCRTLIE